MITELTDKKKLVEEFNEDKGRAAFWFKKEIARVKRSPFRWIPTRCTAPLLYESPKTGNKWMCWWDDSSLYLVCYRLLTKYMMMMSDSWSILDDGTRFSSLSVYTSHFFQRLHERLGMDVSEDRVDFLRRFGSVVSASSFDVQKHEDCYKVACMIGDAALSLGNMVTCGDVKIIYYRSFLPRVVLSPAQKRKWKDLLS